MLFVSLGALKVTETNKHNKSNSGISLRICHSK